MKATKCVAGSIFLLKNQYEWNGRTDNEIPRHNYIVIGTIDGGEDSNCTRLAQVMLITSMRNKTITKEVPIILTNGMISYVVPYNIYSVPLQELENGRYHGTITDDILTKDEFILMLLCLYTESLKNRLSVIDTTEGVYDDYCNRFYEKYSNYKEFRETPKRVYPVVVDTKMEKEVPVVEEVVEEKPVTRRKSKRELLTTAEITAIKSLDTAPKKFVEWSNTEIQLFVNAVDMYGCTIVSNLSARFNSPGAVYSAYKRAVTYIK